jgi:ABC-type nitrate/sulfonate/bicarbonate transport system substrate-binding protein
MERTTIGRRSGRVLTAAVVAALALIGAACGDDDGETAAEETTSTAASSPQTSADSEGEATGDELPPAEDGVGTIQVASLPIPHNIQFIELPRFAEEYGLDVEWVSFQRYADTQLAVSQGDVAFAAAGYHTIALDTAPTNTKIVAGGNAGAQALVIREGVEVTDWEDLAGLRVGVAPNSGPDIQFTLAAGEAGFDPSSIERVNFTTIGPPTIVALQNGEIDGMLCWELNCAQAVVDGLGYYAPFDIGDNPTGNANTLMLANAEWIEEFPNATTRLVRAYVDAVEEFRSDPDAWADAVAAVTGGGNVEVLRTALDTIDLEWELYRDRALATAQAYAELGVSTRDMSEEVESYLDYRFLEQATGKTVEEVGG